MSLKKSKIPRGIRNNNPLNIRVGNDWKGEVSDPTDHTFEQFTEMKYGVRAAFVVLHNYIVRHKINTIEKIVSRWAPSSENDTKAYINSVAKWMEQDPSTEVNWHNKPQMYMLVEAMCMQENGECIDLEYIVEGYELANQLYV